LLVSLDSKTVKFFGFSSKKETDDLQARLSDKLNKYLTPEQTHRIGKAADHRTDIFSFGVLFYELLTRRLPFEGKTTNEYFAQLLSHPPMSPSLINHEVPESVSKVILKCISKSPEERYASIRAVKKDIITSLNHLYMASNQSEEVITAYEKTVLSSLQAAQQNYEHTQDLLELGEAYNRIMQGNGEILLVTGDPGIGKSILVYELQKKVVSNNGYFLLMRFNASQKNIPFHGVVGGFKHLLLQMMGDTNAMIETWSLKIPQAVWPYGKLLIELIPELKMLGPQMLSEQSMNTGYEGSRDSAIIQALIKFLEVFALAQIPLVFLFDDLQWADAYSLRFLLEVADNHHLSKCLVIGTYKRNEIHANHPFAQCLEKLCIGESHAGHPPIHTIQLTKLGQILQDIFNCSDDKALLLAESILKKSRGNAFIALHLLKMLYYDKYIHFNRSTQQWDWNLRKIDNYKTTTEISDLIVTKLSALDKDTQSLIKKAAVIGTKFDLPTLSTLTGQSEERTLQQLQGAVFEDLIIRRSQYVNYPGFGLKQVIEKNVLYAFVNELANKIAYSLLTKQEREEWHYRIARVLYDFYGQDKNNQHIYEIAHHFNAASRLIKDDRENDKLIKLNITAGQKAKQSGNFQLAVDFFKYGIQRLPVDAWTKEYGTTASLYENLGICMLLLGQQKEAEQQFKLLLEKAPTIEEKARIYIILIKLYGQLNLYNDSLKYEGEALRLFNVKFQKSPSKLRIVVAYLKIKFKLLFRSIDDLKKMPDATNPDAYLLGSIYNSVLHTTFASGNRNLSVYTALRLMSLFVEYGRTEFSTIGVATYATLLSSYIIEDFEKGYEFGRLSIEMGERYLNRPVTIEARIIFYLFVNRWHNPISTNIQPLQELAKKAFDLGSGALGVGALVAVGTFKLASGTPLPTFAKDVARNLEELNKHKTPSALATYQAFKDFCHYLIDLEQPIKTEKSTLMSTQIYLRTEDPLIILRTTTWKIAKFVFMGHFVNAYDVGERLMELTTQFPNESSWNYYYFYFTLALAQKIRSTSIVQNRDLKLLKKNLQKIKRWAVASPCNYEHHYQIIQALTYIIEKNGNKAIESFNLALRACTENYFVHEEALCQELLADYYLSLNKNDLFETNLRQAHHNYQQWGAKRKVATLEEKYPFLKDESVELEKGEAAAPQTQASAG
jgi:predicted ATPase